MRVILSRKGFDSGYGGMPSPVLPDGTMLSMPIPSKGDLVRYKDLRNTNLTYANIIQQLKPNNQIILEECHLDPDIRQEAIVRLPGWKPAFGQIDAARSHLQNQGVGPGDLFLFFGWFRNTEVINGRLQFVGPSSGFHAIYGYMEVGEILTRHEDVPIWLESHPHAREERWVRNNASSGYRETTGSINFLGVMMM